MSTYSLDYIENAIQMLEGAKAEFNKAQYITELGFLASALQDVQNAIDYANREQTSKQIVRGGQVAVRKGEEDFEREAFNEGARARMGGERLKNNPYDGIPWKHQSWTAGWFHVNGNPKIPQEDLRY